MTDPHQTLPFHGGGTAAHPLASWAPPCMWEAIAVAASLYVDDTEVSHIDIWHTS